MMLKLSRKLVRPCVQQMIVAVSRDRVTGEDLENARTVAAFLRKRGYEVTLAYWNRDHESPAAVVSTYEEALHAVGGIGGHAYLSIKAPAFGFDARLYDGLLTQARELGVPLHFDSLGPEAADRTFSLITDRAAAPLQAIGCTLPGRWQRSAEDAERLAGLGVAIRVVKGEYPDPDAPTLDPKKGFLDVVARLAGRAGSVRIATHDSDLAQRSIRILRQAGTPCDLELLYGFPVQGLLPQLKDMNVPIRVYVPFGYGWIPYCLKHVRARPAFLWWLVRDSLAGRYPDGFAELGPSAVK
jgi:proline dehydrogenase